MCKKDVVTGFLQRTNFFMWRLTHFSHESTKVLAAQSCPTLCDPMDCSPPDSMGFSRQEYWSGLPFPFPGVFPTQGSSPGVLHGRPILFPLSHQESAFLSWTLLKKWVYMIFCFKREKKKKKLGCRLKILFNNPEHTSLITKLSAKPKGILNHCKNSKYIRFGFTISHTNPSTHIRNIVIW